MTEKRFVALEVLIHFLFLRRRLKSVKKMKNENAFKNGEIFLAYLFNAITCSKGNPRSSSTSYSLASSSLMESLNPLRNIPAESGGLTTEVRQHRTDPDFALSGYREDSLEPKLFSLERASPSILPRKITLRASRNRARSSCRWLSPRTIWTPNVVSLLHARTCVQEEVPTIILGTLYQ